MNSNNKSNKKLVLDLYKKVIGERNSDLIDDYISDNYIQHSPSMKDGKAGLREAIEFLKRIPKPEHAKSPILLALAEEDYVILLLELTLMGKHLCVADLFKVVDGKIVEHWDAIQDVTNQNVKIPQFSFDEEKTTKQDIAFIRSLYETQLHGEQLSALMEKRRPAKVHRIIAEGNVIAVQSEGTQSGKPFVFYDFIKINHSSITEFWTVEQEIPTTMTHNNGML